MGQYFLIVNPAKKQYLDIGNFGENNKASGYMFGFHPLAVALLVCNPTQVRYESGEPRHGYGALAGSWFSDPIYAAGDDYGLPDEFGISTATDQRPDRNLYWLAKEEYEDITYKAIAMLCTGKDAYAREMASCAATYDGNLVHYGNVVFQVGCEPLEKALAEIIGANWTKKYKQARERWPV